MAGDRDEMGTASATDQGQVDELSTVELPKPKPHKVYPLKQHPSWNNGPDINNMPPTHDARGKMKEYMVAQRVTDGRVRCE